MDKRQTISSSPPIPPSYFKKLNVPRSNTAVVTVITSVCFSAFIYLRTIIPSQSVLAQTSTGLIITTGGFVTYCLIIAVYRYKFHPLAKYPGPFWAKITDWYSVYHCYVGDRHLDFYELHLKYGNVVRYGPHRISINSATALRDIYSVRANVQKSQFFSVFSHFFKVPMSMTTLDRKAHAFKRRIDAEALTPKAIQELEPLVLKNVRYFCRKMIEEPDSANGWSKAKNISEWTGYLLTDIMGDIVFHRSWRMMESTENRNILEVLSQGVSGLNIMGHMPGILKFKLEKIFFRSATEGTYQYQALSVDQSEWRMAQGSKITERDLFRSLLEARDPETGEGFTKEALISEAGLLIIAGSRTTASAITATLFYLLKYPGALKIVREELLGKFTHVEEIKGGQDLHSCHYIRACLDEAMRLSPGVSSVLPREVLLGGMNIDGNHFPAGTDVGVSSYVIQHNEAYFPSPFVFQPGRWLQKSQSQQGISTIEEISRMRSAYCPFSVGRASCVGQQLAYNEIMTILARLVWLFEMRLQPGTNVGEGMAGLGVGRERHNELQLYDFFVAAHDGPMVEFKFRPGVSME